MEDIIDKLKRWSEIAQTTFEKKDWNKCSLLHSFGDKLSRDLEEAIKEIEYFRNYVGDIGPECYQDFFPDEP